MSSPSGETRELTLTLTTDEANLVLAALGRLPFAKVYALVAKVQRQAREQLAGKPVETPDAT
jgi:hypothetical protein